MDWTTKLNVKLCEAELSCTLRSFHTITLFQHCYLIHYLCKLHSYSNNEVSCMSVQQYTHLHKDWVVDRGGHVYSHVITSAQQASSMSLIY